MSEVVSGEAVVLVVPCARFPSRLIALLIDMLVQVIRGIAVVPIIIATGTRLDAASGQAGPGVPVPGAGLPGTGPADQAAARREPSPPGDFALPA